MLAALDKPDAVETVLRRVSCTLFVIADDAMHFVAAREGAAGYVRKPVSMIV